MQNDKKLGFYELYELADLISRVNYHLYKGNIDSYDNDSIDKFIKIAIEEIGIKHLFNQELFDNPKEHAE